MTRLTSSICVLWTLAAGAVACGGDKGGSGDVAGDTSAAAPAPLPMPANSASVTGMPAESAAAAATAIPPAPPTVPQAAMAMNAVGGSGLTGEIATVDKGASTDVTVKLAGAPTGSKVPLFVHAGSCASPGAVAAPLGAVTISSGTAGSSTTSVALPMKTLMDGNHAVIAHEPNGNPGKPAACADLPRMPG